MKQCADPKTEALARNDSHPPQRATSHAMNQGWDVGNATVIWPLCIYEGAPRSKPKNWISVASLSTEIEWGWQVGLQK